MEFAEGHFLSLNNPPDPSGCCGWRWALAVSVGGPQQWCHPCRPLLPLLCQHRGPSPRDAPASPGTARSGQIRARLLVKLMVIPADTKGKRRRIFLLWMDESKNPQPAMAAFNIPDLHTMCSGKTGPQSWMLQQLISVLTIRKNIPEAAISLLCFGMGCQDIWKWILEVSITLVEQALESCAEIFIK